jgi:hypothetical protein
MNEAIGEQARKLERDAIVAWLRQLLPEDSGGELDDEALDGLADAIERGDHLEVKP